MVSRRRGGVPVPIFTLEAGRRRANSIRAAVAAAAAVGIPAAAVGAVTAAAAAVAAAAAAVTAAAAVVAYPHEGAVSDVLQRGL